MQAARKRLFSSTESRMPTCSSTPAYGTRCSSKLRPHTPHTTAPSCLPSTVSVSVESVFVSVSAPQAIKRDDKVANIANGVPGKRCFIHTSWGPVHTGAGLQVGAAQERERQDGVRCEVGR